MANDDINDLRTWTEFCSRLIAKTKRGALEWRDWEGKVFRSDARSPLFVAEYKAWKILVFRYAYKYFYDEDQFEWAEEVAIELIDDAGKSEWKLPKVPNRHELLDQIQYNHAEVQSLLNDILTSDD